MRHITTAGPAIERRLAEWLQARDGLLYVREPADAIEPNTLHVLPAATPWQASCGAQGLAVMIGGFRKDITQVAFDDRQCEHILSIVGAAMLRLTEQSASQPRKEKP